MDRLLDASLVVGESRGMRMTKAPHSTGEIVTIAVKDALDPFAICDGLRVRITGLYWEEDAWGYSIEPETGVAVDERQRRALMMVTLHDRDFAA